MANKTGYQTKAQKSLILTVIVIMLGVTFYISNYWIQHLRSLQIGAASGKAELFFEPTTASLSPNASVNLWVTTDKAVGYVRSELTFDPAVLKLTQELTLATPSLSRIIRQTPIAEANSTGKISLILGLEPSKISQAPTGSFKLATLNFATKTTAQNMKSTLGFNPATMQIVDLGATPFVITQIPATLTLNPVASATPVPTSTPTSTSTPAPTSSGTGPSVTFIRPPKLETKSGADQIYIGVQATPSVGPATIEFWFDGVKINAYNNSDNKYQYTYKPSGLSSGNHTITMKVYDNTPSKNKTELSATITK